MMGLMREDRATLTVIGEDTNPVHLPYGTSLSQSSSPLSSASVSSRSSFSSSSTGTATKSRLPYSYSYTTQESHEMPMQPIHIQPIRRRFHSSDLTTTSDGMTNLYVNPHMYARRSFDSPSVALRRWVAENAYAANSSGEVLELNGINLTRRRTFSENGQYNRRFEALFPVEAAHNEDDEDDDEPDEEEDEEEDESDQDGEKTCSHRPSYDSSVCSSPSYSSSANGTPFTEASHAISADSTTHKGGQSLEKLRNLQKLFQEGFITVTEYKDRRHQLVDELTVEDRTIAKATDLLSSELPIIYRGPPDFSLLRERDAIKHVFDSEKLQWTYSLIKVKIDPHPFAKGGLRQVFHLQDLSVPTTATTESGEVKPTSYVAKIAINLNENPDTYFRDVEMQAVASKFAKLYNSYNPPRRVDFLEAWILQLIPSGQDIEEEDELLENVTLRGTICGVEPFIEGEYHKHNNNFGYVSELERNTPQTFSHFTYEASGRQILVVDIQGVRDHYTDPQIHTRSGKEFGKGNLSIRGFEKFLASHRCNPICQYLKLPLNNPKDDVNTAATDRPIDPKGTIPAQKYMSQPSVRVDKVDEVLCHYYGQSNAFKRYQAKRNQQQKLVMLNSEEAAAAVPHVIQSIQEQEQDRQQQQHYEHQQQLVLCSASTWCGVHHCVVS